MFLKVLAFIEFVAVISLVPSPGSSQVVAEQEHLNNFADETTDSVVILSLTDCCAQSAWPEAETAVSEELRTFNLTTKQIEGFLLPQNAVKMSLVKVAGEHQAHVVLHITKTNKGDYRADIVTIRPNGQTKMLQLHFSKNGDAENLQTAVLRIVEAIRAILFKKKIESTPKKEKIPTPSKNTPNAPFHSMGIGVSAAAVYSPGGVAPSLGMNTNLHFQVAAHLLIQIDFTWAFYTEDITYEGEIATFDISFIRGNLYWNFIQTGKVHPALGLGAGAVIAKSAGRADTNNDIENFEEKDTVTYVGVTGRIAFDISTFSTFVLNIRGGILAPKLKIHVREELAATYGRPLLEGFCGFEFRFL